MNKKLNIRKQLGKEQYELIRQREAIHRLADCSEMYGCTEEDSIKFKIILKELNDKIESLKLLRKALKII